MDLLTLLSDQLILSPAVGDQELKELANAHFKRQKSTLNFLERKITAEEFLETIYELGEDPEHVLEVAESNLDFVIRNGIELE